MSDLISRKALIKDMFSGGYTGKWTKREIEEMINAQPTALDVEEVVEKITDKCGKAATKGEYKAYWAAAKIAKEAVKGE